MATLASAPNVPTSEKELRDLARSATKFLPKFAEKDPIVGVKELHGVVDPLLETTDLPDLSPSHRAAASNALCAVIECCQACPSNHVREEILGDSIWLRAFEIYLARSENAKGKSMRQMLLVLTNVITRIDSPRAFELRRRAASIFLDIICDRQDRLKVKPALQGLAHFLLRDVISVAELVELYKEVLDRSKVTTHIASPQTLFRTFLAWIVHHDTSLSAGHLVKNFLIQARKLSNYMVMMPEYPVAPLWIEPVIQMLHAWPDRMQEFKTHVFSHCLQPNIEEYLRFLSYLHFSDHIQSTWMLPESFQIFEQQNNGLSKSEEFRVLLAAIESGKELNIICDKDSRIWKKIRVQEGIIQLPDDIFGPWMSHTDPEVRLAGMFLSVHSTAITRPMTAGIFRSLKQNLVHLQTDTDAYFRRDVNGYLQKLFDRLRASTATLVKGSSKASGSGATRLPIPNWCSNPGNTISQTGPQDLLYETLSFIVWYIRFLRWEIRSTAAYQRRITALQSLTIVLRSGIDPGVPVSHLSKSAQGQLNWAHGVRIASPNLTRVLMDLILDPFDDIRNSAISVLQLCLLAQPPDERDAVLGSIPHLLSRAESMQLRTGRADQADGVARAYSLLYSSLSASPRENDTGTFSTSLEVFLFLKQQLKDTLAYANKNLSDAVNGRPVHGIFAALRYIVDHDDFYDTSSTCTTETFGQWSNAHGEILDNIEIFWNCVQHILCTDAPEGHVPEEIDEESSLDTKEILSYSWRGLKEASVLLRVMITKAPIGDDDRALISPALFKKLGQLCFTQLLELRHRGAFSTVSQTFAAFCRRCVSSNIPALRALPEIWYQETFQSMQAKAGAITRRSAGIPALMASILAAEPGTLFPRAMRELIAEASIEAHSTNIEESRLPQVHALNCIKEFFTTSRLNVASEAYLGKGLELAAKMLNSNIWPIRNCSLMLFKALIERLLGSSEAQDWKELGRASTSRFSYDDYPSLVGILSDLLDPEGALKQSIESTPSNNSPLDLHGAEGVFPALQILRQARPPESNLQFIVASIEKLLTSTHWHLRDMAARTVVALRPVHKLREAAFALLSSQHKSHNLQHGTLLAVKYMLRKALQDPDALANSLTDLESVGRLMQELSAFTEGWYNDSICPFTRATFLDIISLCGMTILRRSGSKPILYAWEELTLSVSIGPQYALKVSIDAGSALLRRSLAQVFFIDRVILRESAPGQLASQDHQDIGEALMLLALYDYDTCYAALETLDKVFALDTSNDLAVPLELVLAHVHKLLSEATDVEIVSKAQAVLAKGLTNNTIRSEFFALISEDQCIFSLSTLEHQCVFGPPSNMQNGLQLLGFFLDFAYISYPHQRATVLAAAARYIRLLRTTIVDTNPFDTRFAAVQSLSALSWIWAFDPHSKATGPLLLGLALVLYDLLNDDDDEIRNIAASSAASLFQTQGYKKSEATVPLLTSHKLATFLAHTFASSTNLANEAVRRLLCIASTSILISTSATFADVLAEARKEDTSLFATEKQNLYKDDTLDAMVWSRVLLLMPTPLQSSLLSNLTHYVKAGLAVLTATMAKEHDDALGWSSKAEVFTLGIRLICVAEVLILRGEGETRGIVMRALRDFADACRRNEGHGLWMERMESVLEKGVLRMLKQVKRTLEQIG
ncbi:putative death-receptor fusion protein-domain-containing protein [Phaeosphaeria sp. MPI-PUGE-AT-0046c]|nr:putative death-receptor fusion protein-domain-containing protein [Phaeosphaeria sp. MPI-PUGE-AT-0046c]